MNSPLKALLARELTKAVENLDWDFTSNYYVEGTPQSAAEVVSCALDECEFNDVDIFRPVLIGRDQEAKFPVDFYAGEKPIATVVPKEGRIPERAIECEEVHVPSYKIGNSVDINEDYRRDRRTDVLQKAIRIMAQGFINRVVYDQNRTIAASVANKPVDIDSTDVSKIALEMDVQLKRMKRTHRGAKITDLYVTPEAYADIEFYLKKNPQSPLGISVFNSLLGVHSQKPDGHLMLYGMRVHLDPVRVDEITDAYYDFNKNSLAENRPVHETLGQKIFRWATFGPRKIEVGYTYKPLMLGIDKTNEDCFIYPYKEHECQIFNNPALHRQQRCGVYGWLNIGCAAMNKKQAVLGVEPFAAGEWRVISTELRTPLVGRLVEKVLPLKRSGGWKGWWRRWW